MRSRVTILVLGLAAGALFFAGVRYTRNVGASLTAHVGAAGNQARPTVRFVKNPLPVPDFAVKDLEGRVISSADWRGKVTIVNFWATWCPPCRAEIPDLIALQNQYPDQLQIIGVSTDEGPIDGVRKFAATERINYPVVMITPELRTAFPGVFALPTSFVVDTKGRAVQKHVGLISPDVYEAELRVLAGLPGEFNVEEVEDSGQILLANAALATEIPGLDLSKLTAQQKLAVLQRLNADKCPCGCDLTLAQCRINDTDCSFSLPIAQQVVRSMTGSR